jgi:pilus assembly protein FimV
MTYQDRLRLNKNNNKLTKRTMPWRALAFALVCFTNPLLAQAYTVGHAQVISASGQPLVVSIPLRNLTANDLTQIQAKVSAPAQWQSAGLKPPVTIESITVEVLPAPVNDPSQRLIKISSTERAQGVVVDLLIEIVTPSGVKPVQASIIVLPAVTIATPGGQTLNVQRGDTLWSIAEKYPTAGANVYQSLLALFRVNPNAFIDKNMNLLRTGATLNLPTSAQVLAINAADAQRIFNLQLQAFNAMRGGRAAPATPAVKSLSAAPNQPMSKGLLDTPVDKQANSGNEVRLASPDAATQQADQNTSAARQASDEKARIQALQDNLSAKGSMPSGSNSNSVASNGANSNGANSNGANSNGANNNGANSNGASSNGANSNGSNSSSSINSNSSSSGAGSNNVASQNGQGTNNQNLSASAPKPSATPSGSTTNSERQFAILSTVENTFNSVRSWLVNNTFIAAIILLAIITWLITLFMKNASNRRNEDSLEYTNSTADLQQRAFNEKLGSIDLNLNDDSKDTEKKI